MAVWSVWWIRLRQAISDFTACAGGKKAWLPSHIVRVAVYDIGGATIAVEPRSIRYSGQIGRSRHRRYVDVRTIECIRGLQNRAREIPTDRVRRRTRST